MSHQTEVDVFISGCGPVGLFAAINLVRYGMTVRIVDIFPSVSSERARATLLQPRSLELLHQAGFCERFLKIGRQTTNLYVYNQNCEEKLLLDINNYQDTEYQFTLQLRQHLIEQLLIDELAAYGVLVERPVELVDFVVDGKGGVLSSLKDLNTGSISFVRSKYLLGCDGSHSFIRKRLGIPMEGDTTETLYGRIDGIIKTNLPRPDELCRIQGEMGSASAVPIDSGYTRVGFTVKTADSDDPINRHNVTLDMLLERAIQSFKPFELEFEEVVWWTVYQGLNIGFMDAHNIAWKIFWRERKGAQPILLDTYQEERRFVAERVIELDRKQTSLSVGRGLQGSSPGLNSNVEKVRIDVSNVLFALLFFFYEIVPFLNGNMRRFHLDPGDQLHHNEELVLQHRSRDRVRTQFSQRPRPHPNGPASGREDPKAGTARTGQLGCPVHHRFGDTPIQRDASRRVLLPVGFRWRPGHECVENEGFR
ncbi:hypothetical protein BC936DRAFT_141016 [Jimgerdemannia flammicorona]|uniref:FAD-binding domain-containing protein n=1 Tax=Jimgerdemannia flammicorona TaxID=994334 RepID=A0A433DGF0_9FUNG|nr:hypothetical protein BC936DRAFT_141016 [Jimgerdemannia flammicorona]